MNFTCKKQTLLTVLFFVILPLYSTPLVIKGMFNGKKWAFVLWACLMGFIGILYPPSGDLYMYTQDFLLYKECNLSSFIELQKLNFDFILPFISFCLGKLGMPFDLSRFLYNSVGYYLMGNMFLTICDTNKYLKGDKNIYLYALLSFLTISFSLYLFRFFFSMIVFAYGVYKIVYQDKKYGYVFLLFSCLNHFSFFIFVFVFVLSRLHFFYFHKVTLIILILFIFFVDDSWAISLFQYFPIEIIDRFIVYLDGYWAGEFLNDFSIRYRIMVFLQSFIVYVGCYVYYVSYNKRNVRYCSHINACLLLVLIVSPFATMYGRFLMVLLRLIKVNFLTFYDGSRFMKRNLMILFYSAMLSNVVSLWSIRRGLEVSELSLLLYANSYQIISHSYDEVWILNNIDIDGAIIQAAY